MTGPGTVFADNKAPGGLLIWLGLASVLAHEREESMDSNLHSRVYMKRSLNLALMVCAAITLSGCMSAGAHRAAVRDDSAEQLTLGTVQRKIRVGMPASDVASVMGSPNIVTTDENRREVWIYDKISTERVYSTSEGGVATLILGGALVGSGLAGGAVAPHGSQSAGAESTTQRTLTVVIKFDEQMKVRDFAYHASRF